MGHNEGREDEVRGGEGRATSPHLPARNVGGKRERVGV